MQAFIFPDFHSPSNSNSKQIPPGHSMEYYLEKLQHSTLQNNKNFTSQVLEITVLDDGGTIHLYLSAPETSALGNHTDIVVLQLDGEKTVFPVQGEECRH